MAEGLNRVTLVGNVGMDPELKFTQGGQAVLKLRVATNESYLDKSGNRQDKTEWHTIVVWGKRAEGLNKVLSKGSGVWIEGSLQTRSWEDKNGEKRYATEVNARNVGLVGGKPGGQSERSQGSFGGRHRDDFAGKSSSGQQRDDFDSGGGGGGGGYDDEIPF